MSRFPRSSRVLAGLLSTVIVGGPLAGCTVGPEFVSPLTQVAESKTPSSRGASPSRTLMCRRLRSG